MKAAIFELSNPSTLADTSCRAHKKTISYLGSFQSFAALHSNVGFCSLGDFNAATSSAALSKIRRSAGFLARLPPFPVLSNSFPVLRIIFPVNSRTGKRGVTHCISGVNPGKNRPIQAKSARSGSFSLFFPC